MERCMIFSPVDIINLPIFVDNERNKMIKHTMECMLFTILKIPVILDVDSCTLKIIALKEIVRPTMLRKKIILQEKQREICIVCTKEAKEHRKIESQRIKNVNLSELLQKYGGISVVRGTLCRYCYDKLILLDRKCRDFYEQCQKNFQTHDKMDRKRAASSPAASEFMKKRDVKNTPSKIKTRLFTLSTPDEDDIRELNDTIGSDRSISPDIVSSSVSQKSTRSAPNDHSYGLLKSPSRIPLRVHFSDEHSYSRSNTNVRKQKADKNEHKKRDFQNSKRFTEKYAKFSKLCLSYRGQENQCLPNDDVISLQKSCQQNDVNAIVSSIFSSSTLRQALVNRQKLDIQKSAAKLNRRKHFYVSELMKKSFQDLKQLDWNRIVCEMQEMFPDLFVQLLGMMLDDHDISSYLSIQKVIPRLGLVYGILMQGRNKELSIVQRTISMLLFDHICDQKVFNRLQPVGVCLGYERSLRVMEQMGGKYKDELVATTEEGKKFRLVGDNINWTVGVHDERQDNRGHMQHAFGSAAIVQNLKFDHLSNEYPQKNYFETPVPSFIPSDADLQHLRREYIILMSRVAFKHIPFFQQFKDIVPLYISKPVSPSQKETSKVIPLPVLYKNEQYYQDVVEILAFYEELIVDIGQKTGTNESEFFVHIGGSRLTRERFSGAKALRGHEDQPRNRFENLSPITFELFHMNMNFLKMAFKTLYNTESVANEGTLIQLQNMINRTSVHENVTAHYDSDKDFFISVVDMYLVEFMLEFFGMDDIHSHPTKHHPPEFGSNEEKSEWYFRTMETLIDEHMDTSNISRFQALPENIEVDGEIQEICLPLANGNMMKINVITKTKCKKSAAPQDKVYAYGHRILELGLLFKNWLDLCKMPERNRGIRLLKHTMLLFKSHNNLSKYALEILRLLVHQICILSEKGANEEFYGLFVNTTGRYNGHIPADLRMEYLVKQVKEHIKHMFNNKTERSIRNRSSAIACVREISDNFDRASSVVVRSKTHSDKSAQGDELSILDCLRRVRPFKHQPGRFHEHFRNIKSSSTIDYNVSHYHQWIGDRKERLAVELGN